MNLVSSAPEVARSPSPGHAATFSAKLLALPEKPVLMTVCLALAFLWAFWPAFAVMAERWFTDPQYSHGLLVPLFSMALLWMRRKPWPELIGWPSVWGLGFLLVGVLLRLNSARMDYNALDAAAVLPTLAGLVLLLGGWPMLRWSWPSIAYLGFMLPLPFAVEQGLSQPLRRLATLMSTFLLETLGLPAVAEGHLILIDDATLKVAEACSGLGMLMTFFALSTATAILVRRSWADKIVIVFSAIPIAVLANVLRITATGVAYIWIGPEVGQFLMHDLAGWLMMPVALLMLWWEIWLIDFLFRPVEESAPLQVVPSPRRASGGR